MSDLAGFDMTPDSGSTLRKVLKLNLGPYMEQFETISGAASKVSLTLDTRGVMSFKRNLVHTWCSIYSKIKVA